MIFRFEDFELDTSRRELRAGGEIRPIQPQVFDLLHFLLNNAQRMVSKDEVVEKIWDGRFISDAALNSCVRLARQVLDDDGKQQRLIRTVHGSGFRFMAEPKVDRAEPIIAALQVQREESDEPAAIDVRPAIAVLPFTLMGSDETHAAIADAVPAELISSLSRMRWLKVIARGSSFQFRDSAIDLRGVSQQLDAPYILTGSVELMAGTVSLSVELNDARSGHVVWSDRHSGKLSEVFELREQIAKDVVNALELQIPIHEADLLRITPPEHLTAWGHYHVGMRHMYRYNRNDNLIAERHFKEALALDPRFARAEAARSYTEFQNYFQMFGTHMAEHRTLALKHAERAVDLDPIDPFCALMLGRVKWLYGDVEDGLSWVDRSIQINPNTAFGHYNSALLLSVLCDGERAVRNAETAIALSPLDPHLQSMFGTRAMAAFVSDDLETARIYADRAVRAPNPHLYVFMIAAAVYSQVGDNDAANACVERLKLKEARFGKAEFFHHYDLRNHSKRRDLERSLDALGI